MLNDSDIEKLTQKQVTIEGELGETTFTFEKMMALKAWKLALSIREEAGKVLEQDLEAIFQMDRNRMVASLFKIVLKMPTPYVILVQETLWEHTFFTNKKLEQPSAVDLQGRRCRVRRARRLGNRGGTSACASGKFYEFFASSHGFTPSGPTASYQPVLTTRIDPYFYGLIAGGLCTYLDLRDRLTLDEAVDLRELLLVRAENQRRANKAAIDEAQNK